jgi:hypothetical protein
MVYKLLIHIKNQPNSVDPSFALMAPHDNLLRSSMDFPDNIMFIRSKHDGTLLGILTIDSIDSRNTPSRTSSD